MPSCSCAWRCLLQHTQASRLPVAWLAFERCQSCCHACCPPEWLAPHGDSSLFTRPPPPAAAAGADGRSLLQAGGSCPNTVWSLINSSPDLSTLKEAVEAAGLTGELPRCWCAPRRCGRPFCSCERDGNMVALAPFPHGPAPADPPSSSSPALCTMQPRWTTPAWWPPSLLPPTTPSSAPCVTAALPRSSSCK